MLFNSASFAVFFPIVFLGYYNLPHFFKRFFLLLASCYFYMAFVPKYIVILFALITLDFFLAKEINKREGTRRKFFLLVSITANIGTLIFFRYFNFLNENISFLVKFLHWNYDPFLLKIALPLGLSFHVFQSLSYIIEVYKKKYTPEKNYVTYALYVMFFPQLVAGPIERPQHLLPQLNVLNCFNFIKARRGLERMLIGFFKKLVIADQLAIIVNYGYSNLHTLDSLTLLFISVLFAYQIYCDFSGYSDIAIGSALMLGYELTENFSRPFSSQTVGEFWRRWHISLSNWLRDYLYYPLVFSLGKMSKFKLYVSSMITFTLIGLWHGANWTYVIFGFLQGVYLTIGSMTEKMRESWNDFTGLHKYPFVLSLIKSSLVFFLFVFSLIFFRSENVCQAFYIIDHIFIKLSSPFSVTSNHLVLINTVVHSVGVLVFLFVVIAIVLMEAIQYFQVKNKTLFVVENKSKVVKCLYYYSIVLSILFFGSFGHLSFIYFQF